VFSEYSHELMPGLIIAIWNIEQQQSLSVSPGDNYTHACMRARARARTHTHTHTHTYIHTYMIQDQLCTMFTTLSTYEP
jgi:hypothetical protein